MIEHTVKSFDNDLTILDNIVAQMGGLVEDQFSKSLAALVKRDVSTAGDIVTADTKVDDLEDEINVVTTRILALRQPMADDLRSVITAMKISTDLERIGDLAKNIAKRTMVLARNNPIGSVHSIARMGSLVQEMIHDSLDAYLHKDLKKAQAVLNQDEAVDELHTSLFRELLTYMMEDPRNITPCTHLLFIAKNIERAGDHATNVAENAFVRVSGELPEDERPKGDGASTTIVKEG